MQEQFDIRPRRIRLTLSQPEFVDLAEPEFGKKLHVATIGDIENGVIGIDQETYQKFHSALDRYERSRDAEAAKCSEHPQGTAPVAS